MAKDILKGINRNGIKECVWDLYKKVDNVKNAVDPFFTPNQNNKIDTYDELKAFFNDTPPVYAYTKNEDLGAFKNMSYYNNNYRTTALNSTLAGKLSEYGVGWVELKKNGLTYSGLCTVCPNGTVEYEYEMDIEGTTNRLCFELSSNVDGGKLYGEIPLEDGFTCNLYSVNRQVEGFSTFEERMNDKADKNYSGTYYDDNAHVNFTSEGLIDHDENGNLEVSASGSWAFPSNLPIASSLKFDGNHIEFKSQCDSELGDSLCKIYAGGENPTIASTGIVLSVEKSDEYGTDSSEIHMTPNYMKISSVGNVDIHSSGNFLRISGGLYSMSLGFYPSEIHFTSYEYGPHDNERQVIYINSEDIRQRITDREPLNDKLKQIILRCNNDLSVGPLDLYLPYYMGSYEQSISVIFPILNGVWVMDNTGTVYVISGNNSSLVLTSLQNSSVQYSNYSASPVLTGNHISVSRA